MARSFPRIFDPEALGPHPVVCTELPSYGTVTTGWCATKFVLLLQTAERRRDELEREVRDLKAENLRLRQLIRHPADGFVPARRDDAHSA